MAVLPHPFTEGLAQNPQLAEKQAMCLHKRDACSAASRGRSEPRRIADDLDLDAFRDLEG
jgi:hypothetical protein